MGSILDSIKNKLNITAAETAFDSDIISFINEAFGTLTQLGVGPTEGFAITGNGNQWAEFYDDPKLSGVETFVYLTTRLSFDPPDTGFTQAAMERQLQELAFRLNVVADYG